MKRVIGNILIGIGGFLCVDMVLCTPLILTTDDMSLETRVVVLLSFIIVIAINAGICWMGGPSKARCQTDGIWNGRRPFGIR